MKQKQTIRRIIVNKDGLLVTELQPGDGKIYPKDGQKCDVMFSGKFKDGLVFQS